MRFSGVALPNGTYEVICYFSANIVDEEDRSEPLEVNLIANGKKQIQRLQIPVGNETIDSRYTITITDEHLTQVVYTHVKGRYKQVGLERFYDSINRGRAALPSSRRK